MCGIIGYSGHKQAANILLESLELLEYRGYDSAGIALSQTDGSIQITRCADRVKELKTRYGKNPSEATCGIGHTRWATHGGVSDANAHPHQYNSVTLVHNGIIENYEQLKQEFFLEGNLHSETDTEIVAGVLDANYDSDPVEAIRKTLGKLRGTYALVILFADLPGQIFAVRNVSPIVAGKTESGTMLASDPAALNGHTRQYFVVPEDTILHLQPDSIQMWALNGTPVSPEWIPQEEHVQKASRNGYPFFMEKEILEQPDCIRRTLEGRISNGIPDFSQDGPLDELLSSAKRILLVACGTAMHAGLAAKALSRSLLHLPMEVELASEFIYSDPVLEKGTLVLAVSQSGETIDTLEAVKHAKKLGASVISILNVPGSSISRESDFVLYTRAGSEIAVASTKAFTTQVSLLYLLLYRIGYVKGLLSKERIRLQTDALLRVPESIEQVLCQKDKLHHMAAPLLVSEHAYLIGRCQDYYTLMEASLKIKEITYIHSEVYASGELKHGPIALITKGTPVLALASQTSVLEKEISNIREVLSRGATLLLFKREQEAIFTDLPASQIFDLPNLEDPFMIFPASVAFQLIAYYISSDKGYDVDKPRNLAKVVTVE